MIISNLLKSCWPIVFISNYVRADHIESSEETRSYILIFTPVKAEITEVQTNLLLCIFIDKTTDGDSMVQLFMGL